MSKKYYKIVKRVVAVDKLFSFCWGDLAYYKGKNKETYGIEYKANEFVFPKVAGTKLFVFDTLENAKNFFKGLYGYEVWECEVTNPGRCKFLAHVTNFCLDLFWTNKNKHKKLEGYKSAPKGTITCDSVKLLQKVS